VVKRVIPARASDVGGTKITTEGLFTVPLRLSFSNHRTLDETDHAFKVIKTSSEYDALIPAWCLNKHKAQGITEGKLHFPLCPDTSFGYGKIHPEYSITYDKRVALRPDAIHIGAVLFDNPDVLTKLPPQYHKWLLLFDPKESEKLPDNKGCDHRIELKTAEVNLRMGPIYQLTLEEECLLKEYLDKMIREGKVRPSSSAVGSLILFVPKPNRKGLKLCVDYRHLNQNMVKDKTSLPIMQELQDRPKGADINMKIDLKAGFHFIQMLLDHEKYTAFRMKFGLFQYTVMPFGLTNIPVTFQREINQILRPVLGMKLVINTEIHIHQDEGMVVVPYIHNIIIATKGSVEKH